MGIHPDGGRSRSVRARSSIASGRCRTSPGSRRDGRGCPARHRRLGPAAVAVVGADRTIRGVERGSRAADRAGARTEVLGRPDVLVPEEDRAVTDEVVDDWLRAPRPRPSGSWSAGSGPMAARSGSRSRPSRRSSSPTVRAWPCGSPRRPTSMRCWCAATAWSPALVGATRIEEVVPVLTGAVREVLGRDLRGRAAPVPARGAPARRARPGHGDRGGRAGPARPRRGAAVGRRGRGRHHRRHAGGWTAPPAGVVRPDGPGGRRVGAGDLWHARAGHSAPYVQDLFRAVADEAWAALQRVALVTEPRRQDRDPGGDQPAGGLGRPRPRRRAGGRDPSSRPRRCPASGPRSTSPTRPPRRWRWRTCTPSDAAVRAAAGRRRGARPGRGGRARREEVLFQDVTACEIAEGPWHADAGSVAVMGLPLHVAHRTVGALVVAHTIAHPRGFTSLCQQVGAAVAQQAALAVEHARLFEVERDNVQRLRDLDRMKADWMAGVTHDLKAPLTGMLGFVETLRRMTGQVSEDQQREYLNVMSRQADQLVGPGRGSAAVGPGRGGRPSRAVATWCRIDELVAEAVESLQPDGACGRRGPRRRHRDAGAGRPLAPPARRGQTC